MDCHFDALWHYCRPCVASGDQLPFGTDELSYWMPVDQIQFGRDTIPFLLTMRLFTKFLHDRGLSPCSEFARETLAHGLILKDNKKMSKHLGNVVDPLQSISRFGADSLRFYILAKAEPKSDYSWSDGAIAHYHDLLQSFHGDIFGATSPDQKGTDSQVTPAVPRRYVTVFLSKVVREISVLESSVEQGRFDIYARAVARLLDSLHVFKSGYYEHAGAWARDVWAGCAAQAVVYLAPIAPHLAEESWERLGRTGSIFEGRRWPSAGLSEVRAWWEVARGGEKP
jgi:leucyl-tRNA synthetase